MLRDEGRNRQRTAGTPIGRRYLEQGRMIYKPTNIDPAAELAGMAKFVELPRGPEHLVGMGFRCWLAGYQTSNIQCWEQAWTVFSDTLGPQTAKTVISDLSIWVRSVHQSASRDIEVYPAACAGFCRDECMAVAMVAAAQQDACPALKACAYALLETSNLDGVMDATISFATSLRSEGLALSADSIVLAPAAIERDGRVPAQ